jgi:hypothetical protein
MTLTEFLAARLDEVEASALEAAKVPGKDWDVTDGGPGRERDGVLWDEDHANVIAFFDDHLAAAGHAAAHDPRRVLREVAAKRAILTEVVPQIGRMDEQVIGEWGAGDEELVEHLPLLKIMAAVYSDHPDYDDAWRP